MGLSMVDLLLIIGGVIILLVLFFILIAKQYRKVGPNEVLIISGGRKRKVVDADGTVRRIGYRIHIGGGTFVKPFIESAQVLPLDVFTLSIKTPEVLTAQGVSIIAEATAQVKIKGDDYSIRIAAEQFLGKGAEGIKAVSYQILEGCMRAALGTMSVEDVYSKRDDFSTQVKNLASTDLTQMGIAVVSFALKDISDTQGYLEALGKPRIAQVKRDATVAQAEADRDAIIKSTQARKDGDIAKFQAETKIAQASRDYEIKRAEFQAGINQKKAHADLAYDLEKQRMIQQIKREEIGVKIIEKEQSIKLEENEIRRKEMELEASVKKAADARKYAIQAEADAESYKIESEAKGRAEARKLEAKAEAEMIKATGEAEAEAMRKKAESWADYSNAAIYQMIVDKMPELAKAVSEPLSRIEKVVLVGNDGASGASKLTGQVATILAQLPAIVQSLSGIDLQKLIQDMIKEESSQKATKNDD